MSSAVTRVEHFDGETFGPDEDAERLTSLLERVRERMSDGRWYTLKRLCELCGGSEASVSARVRDLRKERFGGHMIERQRTEGGLYVYRMRTGTQVRFGEERR